MSRPLIDLKNVDVALDGVTILQRVSWRLRPGEHWAVLGGNGAGKSTFLKLVRGELWPVPGRGGRRVYAFDGDEQTTAVGIKERIALVSPEAQARYLQQEWRLTGAQVIQSGFGGGDYVYQRLTAAQLARVDAVGWLLGVQPFLRRNVQQISTGELRKVLIARALVSEPRVLVCDEICDGLDAESRARLLAALEHVARNGTQILYTTHRGEELLPAITHRLVLEQGRIVESGAWMPPEQAPSASALVGAARPARTGHPPPASKVLIDIADADVFLNDRPVLHRIGLRIRAGEHWVITGPNGAGKSTLLKLIAGDLHPARGGRVKRFTFTPHNTLWELRRRIGFVSPELQATYREAITGAEAVASGFFSSVGLVRRLTAAQRERVGRLLKALRLQALAEMNILRMSYGEFRRVLLARALVRAPDLLIFDEPFDGLEESARREMKETLERVAETGATLVLVTHHFGDLPRCVTHLARLEAGRLTRPHGEAP